MKDFSRFLCSTAVVLSLFFSYGQDTWYKVCKDLEGIQKTNEHVCHPGISLESSEIHEMLWKSRSYDSTGYSLYFSVMNKTNLAHALTWRNIVFLLLP